VRFAACSPGSLTISPARGNRALAHGGRMISMSVG
jgi:hypothetical protein